MLVAAYQMPAAACYCGRALDHVRARVRECEAAGVTLLCCPEAVLGGLADYVNNPADTAIDAGCLVARLAPLASPTVTIVIGFTESDASGRCYNAAAVYSRGVVVGIYRKRHPAVRRSRYTAGSDMKVFRVSGITIGVLICRDSTDAELAATLVDRGAELLCIPTNNAMPPDRGGASLVSEVRALDARQADTFGVPIVRADVVGEVSGLASVGTSMITRPGSEQICATGSQDGELLIADLQTGTNYGPRLLDRRGRRLYSTDRPSRVDDE